MANINGPSAVWLLLHSFTFQFANVSNSPFVAWCHPGSGQEIAGHEADASCPEMGQSDEVVEVPAALITAENYLPGMAAGSTDPSSLHCVGFPDDDAQCYASLSKGGRCTRKRTHGNFCKQHARQFRQSDRVAAAWGCFEEPLALVAQRFEAQQMDMALALRFRTTRKPKRRGARAWPKLFPACQHSAWSVWKLQGMDLASSSVSFSVPDCRSMSKSSVRKL